MSSDPIFDFEVELFAELFLIADELGLDDVLLVELIKGGNKLLNDVDPMLVFANVLRYDIVLSFKLSFEARELFLFCHDILLLILILDKYQK